MAALDVVVSSPFPIDSLQGNSVSAVRIASRIAAAGLRSRAIHGDASDRDAGALIALHARRSLPVIRAFHSRYPGRPIIVVATGTDLYKDLAEGNRDPLEAMRLANAIVVYQEASAADVPEAFRHKVVTIWKSVELPIPPSLPVPRRSPVRLTILAHLRKTKDPFLPVAALSRLDASIDLRIDHFGNALEPELIVTAQEWMRREPRYRWAGQRRREDIAAIITSSHATINSGRAEGGSNSICESMVLDTPVLATAIPANIGLLGEGYVGYYPPGDAAALAGLLAECVQPDSSLLETLKYQVRQRAPRFRAESETAGWKDLLEAVKRGT